MTIGDKTDTSNRLLGTWQLAAWTLEYNDGRPVSFPYGADATGLLMYTTDGYMSACIARSGRPRFSTANTRRIPGPEQQIAFEGYFQYAGTYEIAGDFVLHKVTHSLNPNFPGTTQKRRIDTDDGDLILSAEESLPGSLHRKHILRWRRQ